MAQYSERIRTEQIGTACVITINRPHRLNAIDIETAEAIDEALEINDRDPEIRAILITGTGDRAFSVGADLSSIARGEFIDGPHGFGGFVRHRTDTPTIAVVNGLAVGGGFEIVLACDLAVASDTASFGLPEARVGVYASGGGPFRLPRQIPQKIALELILTGEPISAERAYEVGLVNRVVRADQLMATALTLAETIARSAPLAVRGMKRIASGAQWDESGGENEDWMRTADEGQEVLATRDAKEGVTAFLEKRIPVWEGK